MILKPNELEKMDVTFSSCLSEIVIQAGHLSAEFWLQSTEFWLQKMSASSMIDNELKTLYTYILKHNWYISVSAKTPGGTVLVKLMPRTACTLGTSHVIKLSSAKEK